MIVPRYTVRRPRPRCLPRSLRNGRLANCPSQETVVIVNHNQPHREIRVFVAESREIDKLGATNLFRFACKEIFNVSLELASDWLAHLGKTSNGIVDDSVAKRQRLSAFKTEKPFHDSRNDSIDPSQIHVSEISGTENARRPGNKYLFDA